jgi:serine/threonine-protein kinase RsbW
MALSKMEIQICSDTLNLKEVESFIKEMFVKYALQTELFYKVLICVNEAVVNSIMHGNKYDENKVVKIQSFACLKFLYFRIMDEGEGFDFKSLDDPTEIKNIYKESGRGIYIIKSISNSIYFREKGNIIEFKIKLSE